MASVFSITSDREVNLKPGGSQDLPILIANQSGHAMRAQASLDVSGDGLKDCVKIVKGDLIWDFAENGVQQLVARIEVPAKMAEGKYRFNIKVVNVAKPDDEGQEGPDILVSVEPVREDPPPWLIPVVVATVLLVVAVIAVMLWVFRKVEVPEVVGMSVARAVDVLSRAGLKGQEGDRVLTSPLVDVDLGEVASQDPLGKSKVSKGSSVTLHVRMSSAPMPRLRGRTTEECWQLLFGFPLGTISTKETKTKPDGTVLDQFPEPGVVMTPDMKVNLVVEGKRWTKNVGDLIGEKSAGKVPPRVREFRIKETR